MDRKIRSPSERHHYSRREFIAMGAMAAGILLIGTPASAQVPDVLARLRGKFREMGEYGIPPLVCWSDPTMRELLSALSGAANAAARSGRPEAFPLSGSTHEEQYRSLNSLLGRPRDSPFGPGELAALERAL
ncbi:MAG: hypothetical protein AB1324_01300 [Candidatus Micrarchaeota archaeon]